MLNHLPVKVRYDTLRLKAGRLILFVVGLIIGKFTVYFCNMQNF